MDWGLFAAGLLIGGLAGTAGIGTASLVAPALILAGVAPAAAIPCALVCAAAVAGAGAMSRTDADTVDRRTLLRLAAGSVPASVVGALVFLRLDVSGAVPASAVALLLALLACVLLAAARLGGARARPPAEGRSGARLAVPGMVIGLVAGFSSMGAGTLTAALLASRGDRQEHGTVQTLLLHAFFVTAAASGVHLAAGTVDLAPAVPLLLGAIPGVAAARRMPAFVSAASLREVAAAIVLLMSVLVQIPSHGADAPLARDAESAAQSTSSTPRGEDAQDGES